MKKLALISILSSFLLSCAGMQIKENCQKMDWQELGRRAGRQGLSEASKEHVEDMRLCHEHGVEPDRKAYIEGVKTGLRQYCSVENARSLGQTGQAFSFLSCTAEFANAGLQAAHVQGVSEFCSNSGYQAGLSGSAVAVHCPESTRARFDSDFQRGRLEYLTQASQSMKVQLNQVSEQVRRLREENSDLQRRNNHLENQNRELKRDLEDLESKLRSGR